MKAAVPCLGQGLIEFGHKRHIVRQRAGDEFPSLANRLTLSANAPSAWIVAGMELLSETATVHAVVESYQYRADSATAVRLHSAPGSSSGGPTQVER